MKSTNIVMSLINVMLVVFNLRDERHASTSYKSISMYVYIYFIIRDNVVFEGFCVLDYL